MDKLKVLHVSSSSYSGSTLISFLLNTHPQIFTVSHTQGWNYGEKPFKCSCGEPLPSCPFFRLIADVFRENQLPFDFKHFGTGYELVRNPRLNRYLTKGMPFLTSTSLERLRDAIIARIPTFRRRLAQTDRANLTFIRTALSYSGASVFVDGYKTPFRLRQLRRIEEFDLHVLYLVRDIRGVVSSNMRKREWDATHATRTWIHEQANIVRILREFPSSIMVYYEDLCERIDETLARIHRFLDLAPHPFPGDFKSIEHHILGNKMRLQDLGKIEKDTRWQRDLSAGDLAEISRLGLAFVRRHEHHPLSEVITHYLGAK